MRNTQLGLAILLTSLIGFSALAEEEKHAEETVAAVTSTKPEDKVSTRQQALIEGMKELKIPRFQLERIATLLEKNPKTTPEQFNKILDTVAEQIPGFLTQAQKDSLKKLYKDELGQVKQEPATEFVSAAKALASKLPVKEVPLNPPANANNPNDPNNTVSTLSGATVTPPGGRAGVSFDELAKLAKGGDESKNLKALEDRISTLQDAFARQQLAGAGPAGQNGKEGAPGEKGGLVNQILGLLKGEGKEKEGRGRGEDRGGKRPPDHTPPAQTAKAEKDEDRESKKDAKAPEPAKRERDRPRGGGQAQASNDKGASKEGDKKEGDKDKDKKAEPIINLSDSKKDKEKPKEPEKTPDLDPNKLLEDQALADAANLFTPKSKPKVSRGDATAGSAIPAQNQAAAFSGAAPAQDPPAGNNGPTGPVKGGSPGGEGSGLGEVPSAYGDSGAGGGGGGAAGGQTYNFIRMTEYMGASGGNEDSPDAPNAGFFDDTPAPAPRKAGALVGNEPLRIMPHVEGAKGWLLDVVGHWRTKICEGPERGNVGWCFKVMKVSKGAGPQPLVIRAGIQ